MFAGIVPSGSGRQPSPSSDDAGAGAAPRPARAAASGACTAKIARQSNTCVTDAAERRPERRSECSGDRPDRDRRARPSPSTTTRSGSEPARSKRRARALHHASRRPAAPGCPRRADERGDDEDHEPGEREPAGRTRWTKKTSAKAPTRPRRCTRSRPTRLPRSSCRRSRTAPGSARTTIDESAKATATETATNPISTVRTVDTARS